LTLDDREDTAKDGIVAGLERDEQNDPDRCEDDESDE
jgi:hypothetical protein